MSIKKEMVIEYYSALILPFVTTWIELKDTMLSEISQKQKNKYPWFYLYEVSKLVKFTEANSRMLVSRC